MLPKRSPNLTENAIFAPKRFYVPKMFGKKLVHRSIFGGKNFVACKI